IPRPTRLLHTPSQLGQRVGNPHIVGAQLGLLDLQRSFQQRYCIPRPTRLPHIPSQLGQRVGNPHIVGSQLRLLNPERWSKQRYCIPRPPLLLWSTKTNHAARHRDAPKLLSALKNSSLAQKTNTLLQLAHLVPPYTSHVVVFVGSLVRLKGLKRERLCCVFNSTP
ncbi:unnamed protein product, partial [Ectocarpus sp. 12 AP-2014]